MADSGFIIDGLRYEVPSLDSFDMDEAQILYDTSGLVLEDFAVDVDDPQASADLQRKIQNPGFIRALMVIAYLRGNREVSRSKAQALIGHSNQVEAIQTFIESSLGGDAGPPEMNEPPVEGGSSESQSEPSGVVSSNGSAEPAEIPAPTGTTESGTFPDRDRELSEHGSPLT